ncbi:hypothetical protein SLEP1_g3460 [Rubroshorea leprosula]|uniref:Uncharacterized protein n=1 Tax=Rubroshorea leprosula TaxID=152421 RepID=A0AAV5HPT4_9ROSI|nr:hypothetical protein SLEP1_g3460 [Rubroshorea leprosula]
MAALEVSDGKLKLRERTCPAAMAAQAATEKSLQPADSKVAKLRDQIKEIMKQLEEAEKREETL